jgi:hypothetical protein
MGEAAAITFEVWDTFHVTNRGSVLVGDVRTGIARVGMLVQLPLNSALVFSERIKGVEIVDLADRTAKIGLLLDTEREDYDFLKQVFTPGTMVSIVEAKETT